jgi:hypothetical protein
VNTNPPTYQVRTIRADHKIDVYEVPAMSPSELARAALRYINVVADGSYERWEADMAEANEFATFCVGETIDDVSGWCDPRRSFRDLWSQFLTATAKAAS